MRCIEAGRGLALILVLGVAGSGVAGQTAGDAGVFGMDPFFGFAIGGGLVPRVFEPNCIDGWDGNTATAAVELRLGSEIGRVGLEVRTAGQTELGLGGAASCFVAEPARPDGIQTVRSSPIDRGPFLMTDIRARYRVPGRRVDWLASGGGGWVWSRGVPTIVIGLGMRAGGDLRAAIDADIHVFRVPWVETTGEWLDDVFIREIDRRSERIWQAGVSVRVGVEVPVNRTEAER